MRKDDLADAVVSLGEFIGLLTLKGDDVQINTAWFENPCNGLSSADKRISSLIATVASVLGDPIDSPPQFSTSDRSSQFRWYTIPDVGSGTPSGLHFVVAPTSADAGQVGIGLLWRLSLGELTIECYCYIPLFAYSDSGVKFLPGQTDSPLHVGLQVTSKQLIKVAPTSASKATVTFKGIDLDSQIYLADKSPTMRLKFLQLQGGSPDTYTTLESLISGQVLEWLTQLVVTGSSWLDFYVGNSQATIGDLFLEAGLLVQDQSFSGDQFDDAHELAQRLSSATSSSDEIGEFLWKKFASDQQRVLSNQASTPQQLQPVLVKVFDGLVDGGSLYDPKLFAAVALSPRATRLIGMVKQASDAARRKSLQQRLNRILLQDASRPDVDSPQYEVKFSQFKGKTASQIAETLCFELLSALAIADVPIVGLPGGGIYVVEEDVGTAKIYGARLAMTDLVAIGASSAKSSTGAIPSTSKAKPECLLQLGKWIEKEKDANSWMQRSLASSGQTKPPESGASVFFLNHDGEKVQFIQHYEFNSIGFDVRGSGGKPLFNINGYTLNGGEIRVSLTQRNGKFEFGAATSLDGLGIPLGPNFGQAVSGSKTNAAAQGLLQSGSKPPAGTGNAASGDKDTINPAFGFSAGYMQQGQLVAQLYDKGGNPAKTVTFPIQRAVGPMHCEKLGIGWVQDTQNPKNDTLSLLFDGGVKLATLDLDLVGLSIGVPITAPGDFSKYDLELYGMGLDFKAGQVELSAALVKLPKTASRPYIEYDGEAIIKAGTLAITALGSYAYVPVSGHPDEGFASLFVFGVLDADLGDPTGVGAMFVTGLAVGFGYNRSLKLPSQDAVPNFPLVAGTSDPSVFGGQGGQSPGPATALAALGEMVPPERGEYWLAAGVRFTSFDLINSTALVVVEFGNELEIALLGLSWISLPPPSAPGAAAPATKFAYGELGIEIKILPSEGVASATAILTPNSFVIDPACKLTGGFAFYTWFGSNPHAGQFVLSLGGYHPDFKPPSYFPQVPRLGFRWPLPGDVTISGDAYFALTPSAVMAGGGLQVLFHKGSLKAWFKASLNVLIEWAPFHYEADISISIGVSLRVDLLFVSGTLKIELGADLKLVGPPMHGIAHIHVYIVSFTVKFGSDRSSVPPPLPWENSDGTGFAQSFLPHKSSSSNEKSFPNAQVVAMAQAVAAPSGIYTITVNDGLLKNFTAKDGRELWVVRGNHFVFSVVTAVPCTQVNVVASNYPKAPPKGTKTSYTPKDCPNPDPSYFVGVRPMKTTLKSSELTITLVDTLKKNQVYDLPGEFDLDVASSSVPEAKWGKPLPSGEKPNYNKQLASRLVGLKNIRPKAPTLTPGGELTLDIEVRKAFTYDVVDGEVPFHPYYLPLRSSAAPVGAAPKASADSLQTIKSSLMSDSVVETRRFVMGLLQKYGVDPRTNGELNEFAGKPSDYLSGNPMMLETE